MLQLLKETGRDYNKFVEDITELVVEKMGKEYKPRIFKVTKNNSLELDSLVLLKEGKNFAPNIYLLPYYEAYREGVDIYELAERLCGIYQNCTTPLQEVDFTYSFDEMKPNIVYRLVNYDRNKKLLEKVPHIRYLDLAITFHCLVHNNADGIGTIRITSEHMELWKVSIKELQVLAVKNTIKRFPPTIRSMEDVIKKMLQEECNEDEFPLELEKDLFDNGDCSNHHKMYILSNLKGINGATCLLYDNVLMRFSEKLRSDLYILPSSIHEVIIVPFDKSISKVSLSEMVKDVNQNQVAEDEVLSDKVYYYSRENNAITL